MQRILIQLDTDAHASVFDRVVAVDAQADHIFSYANVTPEDVTGLVHGAIFTRGPKDLANTAVFIGGNNVAAGEELLRRVCATFFGPMRVSVMMDSSGSNTTAAAAVLAAMKHLKLRGAPALVLGGTGPVGQRVAHLLAAEGALVRVGSRTTERAQEICQVVSAAVPQAAVSPQATGTPDELLQAIDGVELVIAAGAAGVELLPADRRRQCGTLKVAIDLNAVPPVGLPGVEVMDKAVERDGAVCYGAIGVGGLKMKIHKAALRRLFETNDAVLDTAAIFEIGQKL